MFHAALFTLLGGLFCLFAFQAAGAGLLLIAIPSGLLALWMVDAALRSGRGAIRRRRAATNADGRR